VLALGCTPSPAAPDRPPASAAPASSPLAVASFPSPPTVAPSASSVASAPASPPPPPLDLPPARPCEVAAEKVPGGASDSACVDLRRVQPEGHASSACFRGEPPARYRYDAQGRIESAPGVRYRWGKGGAATRIAGRDSTEVRFDLATKRLVSQAGNKLRYDDKGRLVRAEGGGRFIAYDYAPDGTYKTSHNYPDRDEFCEADLVKVTRDDKGRVLTDVYDHCGINEAPHTLTYHYDEENRIRLIEVDFASDGGTDGVVRLRYACE
jgi:hypothetical protein